MSAPTWDAGVGVLAGVLLRIGDEKSPTRLGGETSLVPFLSISSSSGFTGMNDLPNEFDPVWDGS